jgi:hypothetical protein
MSFDTSNISKNVSKRTEIINYDYYDIPVFHQEKTLENNGYIKFQYSTSKSISFSHPNLIYKGNEYITKNLYIFNRYYNIKNIDYNGLLIIENEPINNSVSSNIFTVFLLKTVPNLMWNSQNADKGDFASLWQNDIDKLLTKDTMDEKKQEKNFLQLNKYITNNQKTVVFENVILFTSPINIRSNFNHFVTPQHVSMGILNPFTENYTVVYAKRKNTPTPASNNTIENFDDNDVYNKLETTQFENDVTCQPSENVDNETVSKIAMVPVDSDYLNGVYQITMMRTLFDIFIFIILLFFCIFASPSIYTAIIKQPLVGNFFPSDSGTGSTSRINLQTIQGFLDILFSILLLVVGVFLTIDGVTTTNGLEMLMGIYFTLITVFSICVIHYYKLTGGFDISNGTTYIFKFLGLLLEKKYPRFLFGIFAFFFMGWLTSWLLNYFIYKQRGIHWFSILSFIGIPVSVILSYSLFAFTNPYHP